MYIRRKVFSILQDEMGEERYFSTNEILFEDYDYEQRDFAFTKAGNTYNMNDVKRIMKETGMTASQAREEAAYRADIDAANAMRANRQAANASYESASRAGKVNAEGKLVHDKRVKGYEGEQKILRDSSSKHAGTPETGYGKWDKAARKKSTSWLKRNKKALLIGAGVAAAGTGAGVGIHAYQKKHRNEA